MKRFVLILIIVYFLISCAFSGKKEAMPPEYITVMTYNMHHGVGIDGVFDLDRIAKLIREYDADLVALQEVDVETQRVNGIHIMKYLSDTLNMTWVFGQNLSFQDGGYGNGILSKYPVVAWKNDHFPPFHDGEQRGLLQTVIDFSGIELSFWNIHLDHRPDDTERRQSVSEILQKAGSSISPIIVAGDFNDIPGSPAVRAMTKQFQDVWEHTGKGSGLTYPADSADRRIDYIFYKNDHSKKIHLKPAQTTVPETPASDHLPLVTRFKIVRIE
jgi:endonuclease/exonuclease/phosphatase family metal-dependent hydrolase